nr:MAG TPA: hypothetical protein [Caudoviricetes sp.]
MAVGCQIPLLLVRRVLNKQRDGLIALIDSQLLH